MHIPRCPNKDCRSSGKAVSENIVRFGFYPTRWGRRRRYRCQTCKRTFCSNTGTPYFRLQHRRTTFDQVATLSVEGLNKSAIARVERIGWNTVDRWLEKASDWGRRFNDQEITGLTGKRLTLREIFCSGIVFLASSGIVLAFVYPATSFSIENDVPRAA